MEKRADIVIGRPRGKGDALVALLITAVIILGVLFVISLMVVAK